MFGNLMRFIGAYGLAEFGTAARPAAPALRRALGERDPLIRALAAYALAQASPEDRPAALAALVKIATISDQDPPPGTFDYMIMVESRPRIKEADKSLTLAVLDTLLTQEPGSRFPTDYMLRWAKQSVEQPQEKLNAWLRSNPFSAGLAREMVWRLDPAMAQKLGIRGKRQ
jgi:hypothetical protein